MGRNPNWEPGQMERCFPFKPFIICVKVPTLTYDVIEKIAKYFLIHKCKPMVIYHRNHDAQVLIKHTSILDEPLKACEFSIAARDKRPFDRMFTNFLRL